VGKGLYDKPISDRLLALGEEPGLAPSAAVRQSYDSDAGRSKASGLAARAALISLPTLSTHGYEVMHAETPDRVARLLAEYLCRPAPVQPGSDRR
jgi:putative aminopeptidase FrvX